MSAGSGAISVGATRGASATATRSLSISSGSASTTGPGRPFIATWNARDTISGMRAASSISSASLATGPKTAR